MSTTTHVAPAHIATTPQHRTGTTSPPKQQKQQQQQHPATTSTTHRPVVVDPYHVLQVRRDATHSEIRQSYRRLALLLHPARSIHATGQERLGRLAVFETLAACFETLLDPVARRLCDALLKQVDGLLLLQQQQQQQRHWLPGQVRVGGHAVLGRPGSRFPRFDMPLSEHQRRERMSLSAAREELPSLSAASSHSSSSSSSSSSVSSSSSGVSAVDEEDPAAASDEETRDDVPLSTTATAESVAAAAEATLSSTATTTRASCGSTPRRRQRRHYQRQRQHHRHQRRRNGKSQGHGTRHTPGPKHHPPADINNNNENDTITDPPPVQILGCCQAAASADDTADYIHVAKIFTPGSHHHHYDDDDDGADSQDEQDAQVLQTILNSSSTDVGADIHYTAVETNRLFGGPLQLLFRARRFRAFSNPFEVFASVFANHAALGDYHSTSTCHELRHLLRSADVASSPLVCLPPPQYATAVSGESELLPDGTTLFRKIRILPNRRVVRTEVVRTDPTTGTQYSTVTVVAEDVVGAGRASDDDVVPPTGIMAACWHDDNTCWLNNMLHPNNNNKQANKKRRAKPPVPVFDKYSTGVWPCCHEDFTFYDDDHHHHAPDTRDGFGTTTLKNDEPNENHPDAAPFDWSFTTACESWLPSCM